MLDKWNLIVVVKASHNLTRLYEPAHILHHVVGTHGMSFIKPDLRFSLWYEPINTAQHVT